MSDMFLTLSIYAQKDNPIKKIRRPVFHSKNAKDKNLTTNVPPLPQNTYNKTNQYVSADINYTSDNIK